MATRKVFSDEFGTELSYLSKDGKLELRINETYGNFSVIELEPDDALQFIAELNKLRKILKKDL
jgi:hypothetical protein